MSRVPARCSASFGVFTRVFDAHGAPQSRTMSDSSQRPNALRSIRADP